MLPQPSGKGDIVLAAGGHDLFVFFYLAQDLLFVILRSGVNCCQRVAERDALRAYTPKILIKNVFWSQETEKHSVVSVV